ncbi:PREDICTED: sentrin-specific protease 8-like [Vollenhovia emeryi]|uniref:sentrin-specific protease 8-like n=1 Tax=Vollenhovia emeryi TaxID=411798 RepID=UPI0005F52E22|nr:PREDICTED: sentrin-specific protease 8-like [Vollenhovia emeryi]
MPVLPSNSKHLSSHDAYPTRPDKNNIVLSYHDYLLRASDVALLEKNDWLNDIIIGFYFEYLNQQYKDSRLLFIGPEVAQLLKMQDSSQYNIFLDPIEATNYDFVFFPLNDCDSNEAGGSHWSLLIYSHTEQMCYHFDSSGGINDFSATKLARKVTKYFLEKQERKYTEMKCPQQNNNYDCGLYVLCLADVISRHAIRNSKVNECDCSIVTKMVPTKRTDLLKLIYELKNTYNA